uniref:Uncharacterized protein n=1 Tax=viral metagenome TaxID=1070528 RepID=A0A6C0K9P7_9ZZZZ
MAVAAAPVVYNANFFLAKKEIVNGRPIVNYELIENPEFFLEDFTRIRDPNFFDNLKTDIFTRGKHYSSSILYENILIPLPNDRDSGRRQFEVRIITNTSEINEENESARRINLNEYFLNTNVISIEEPMSALKKKYRITNGPPPSHPFNVPSNIDNHLRLIDLKKHLINYKKILERVLAKERNLAKPLKDEKFENLFTMNLKKSFYEDPLSTLKNIAKVYPNLELNKPEVYGSPEEIQRRIDEIDSDYNDYIALKAKLQEDKVKFNAVINKNGTKKRFRLAPMGGKRRLNKKSRRNRKE